MNRIMRIGFMAICAGLLAWGIARERHQVRSLGEEGAPAREIGGMTLVEGATYDGYVRIGDTLYDARSLAPGTAQEKDCKT